MDSFNLFGIGFQASRAVNVTIERSIGLRELALVLVKSKEALKNATERLVMLLLVSPSTIRSSLIVSCKNCKMHRL